MPDNAIFYYLAYAVATVIYAGYVLLLITRWRRVKSAPSADPSE